MFSQTIEAFYQTLKAEIEHLIEEAMGQKAKVSVYGKTIMIFLPDRIKTYPMTVRVENITRKANAEAIAKIYAQRVVEDILQGE